MRQFWHKHFIKVEMCEHRIKEEESVIFEEEKNYGMKWLVAGNHPLE